MATPTSKTRIPVVLIGIALLFRIGTFLLWPIIMVGVVALCFIAGKFLIEEAEGFPLALLFVPIVAVSVCGYCAYLTMRTVSGHALAVQVRREEQPDLWRFVGQVAESVGGKEPDNIIIGLDANFFVTNAPLSVMNWESVSGRTLYMSAPLLRLMSEEEVKAVLAHEFSHFTGSDTLYSSQVAPAYVSLQNGMSTLRAHMGSSVFMFLAFLIPIIALWIYQLGFRFIDQALSRRRELRCDEIASQVYGRYQMAGSLVKVIGYGWALQYVDHHFVGLFREGQTFTNYPEWFGQSREHWDAGLEEILPLAFGANTKLFDSHPALKDRLSALAVTPDEAKQFAAGSPTFTVHYDIGSVERRLSSQYTAALQARIAAANVGD